MKKEEFIQELRDRLQGIPQNDMEERISYYAEMIDDRMEDGLSEEDAVAAIGPVDSVVEQIMSEIPLTRLMRSKAKPEKGHGAGFYVLLILGFPLWFPLLIAAFAVIFSLYIALWAIVISFYAVDLSLAAGAIVTIPAAVMYFSAGNMAGGGFSVGAGLVCAGVMLLWLLVCIGLTKGAGRLTGAALLGIKRSFVRKEA